VAFDYVDVDVLEKDERKDVIKNIKEINPKCSFPTIIIGETVIVGYKQKDIEEALDANGY
jgi:glutaredoxin